MPAHLAEVVAVLMCAVLFAATTGLIPTPAWFERAGDAISGARYPCEGGTCSCSSVRGCWTTCRCQSLEQKVQWAARHGVEVPSYVDLSRLNKPSKPLAEQAKGLQRPLGTDKPEARPEPACALCSSAKASPEGTPRPLAATGPSDEGTDRAPAGLPTLTPLGCGGVELLAAFAAIVSVMPSDLGLLFGVPIELEPLPSEAHTIASRDLEAATPPPRTCT